MIVYPLARSSYLVHEFLEGVHGGRRESEQDVDALPLLSVRQEEYDLLLRERDGAGHRRLSPAEVGAVEGEPRPRGDEQRGRQGRPGARRLEVVHGGPDVLVRDHPHGVLHHGGGAGHRR